MSRRLSVVLVVGVMALLALGSALVQAASSSSAPLPLQGQVSVDQSGQLPVINFSAQATDGSGYRLNASVAPDLAATQRGFSSRRGEPQERGRDDDGGFSSRTSPSSSGIPLTGQFTLSGPGITSVTGQATGVVNQDGTGQLQLSGGSGSVQANVSFSVDALGGVQMDLSGRVPVAPAPTAVPTPSAQTAVAGSQAQQPNHLFWYITRVAGMSAYLMLFLNTVLGLSVRTRVLDAIMAKWRSFDLHQFTALVAMAFLLLHGASLLADQYIGFSISQVLVPMASSYRPFWTALGVVGFYLILVVTASSYLKRFIGHRAWRAIHYLSLVAYVLALGHGVMAGSDSSQLWARALYWSTGLIVAALVLRRFRRKGTPSRANAAAARPAAGRSREMVSAR